MKTAEKYYMAVVEEQGISEAARKLYITQQSLSEQMQKLEQQYGGKLFLRRPRFQLTQEGELLYGTLQKIRILEDGLDTAMTEIREKQKGRLNIGIHSSRARCILPEAIARFRKQYPHVVLNFYNHDTSDFEQMLLNGDLPQSIGGGIGASRLCMLLLEACHIGEVQAGLWDTETIKACEEAEIPLL